jgi:bifunctional DNA-binding transcriptional regulator/antitoxin component of YhaV-PrlF toxin-antitoxin module
MKSISEFGDWNVRIPSELREKAGFNENTKLVIEIENGKIIIESAAKSALDEFRQGLTGCAEAAGLDTEQSVVDYCKEMRKTSWERFEIYRENSAGLGTN